MGGFAAVPFEPCPSSISQMQRLHVLQSHLDPQRNQAYLERLMKVV